MDTDVALARILRRMQSGTDEEFWRDFFGGQQTALDLYLPLDAPPSIRQNNAFRFAQYDAVTANASLYYLAAHAVANYDEALRAEQNQRDVTQVGGRGSSKFIEFSFGCPLFFVDDVRGFRLALPRVLLRLRRVDETDDWEGVFTGVPVSFRFVPFYRQSGGAQFLRTPDGAKRARKPDAWFVDFSDTIRFLRFNTPSAVNTLRQSLALVALHLAQVISYASLARVVASFHLSREMTRSDHDGTAADFMKTIRESFSATEKYKATWGDAKVAALSPVYGTPQEMIQFVGTTEWSVLEREGLRKDAGVLYERLTSPGRKRASIETAEKANAEIEASAFTEKMQIGTLLKGGTLNGTEEQLVREDLALFARKVLQERIRRVNGEKQTQLEALQPAYEQAVKVLDEATKEDETAEKKLLGVYSQVKAPGWANSILTSLYEALPKQTTKELQKNMVSLFSALYGLDIQIYKTVESVAGAMRQLHDSSFHKTPWARETFAFLSSWLNRRTKWLHSATEYLLKMIVVFLEKKEFENVLGPIVDVSNGTDGRISAIAWVFTGIKTETNNFSVSLYDIGEESPETRAFEWVLRSLHSPGTYVTAILLDLDVLAKIYADPRLFLVNIDDKTPPTPNPHDLARQATRRVAEEILRRRLAYSDLAQEIYASLYRVIWTGAWQLSPSSQNDTPRFFLVRPMEIDNDTDDAGVQPVDFMQLDKTNRTTVTKQAKQLANLLVNAIRTMSDGKNSYANSSKTVPLVQGEANKSRKRPLENVRKTLALLDEALVRIKFGGLKARIDSSQPALTAENFVVITAIINRAVLLARSFIEYVESDGSNATSIETVGGSTLELEIDELKSAQHTKLRENKRVVTVAEKGIGQALQTSREKSGWFDGQLGELKNANSRVAQVPRQLESPAFRRRVLAILVAVSSDLQSIVVSKIDSTVSEKNLFKHLALLYSNAKPIAELAATQRAIDPVGWNGDSLLAFERTLGEETTKAMARSVRSAVNLPTQLRDDLLVEFERFASTPNSVYPLVYILDDDKDQTEAQTGLEAAIRMYFVKSPTRAFEPSTYLYLSGNADDGAKKRLVKLKASVDEVDTTAFDPLRNNADAMLQDGVEFLDENFSKAYKNLMRVALKLKDSSTLSKYYQNALEYLEDYEQLARRTNSALASGDVSVAQNARTYLATLSSLAVVVSLQLKQALGKDFSVTQVVLKTQLRDALQGLLGARKAFLASGTKNGEGDTIQSALDSVFSINDLLGTVAEVQKKYAAFVLSDLKDGVGDLDFNALQLLVDTKQEELDFANVAERIDASEFDDVTVATILLENRRDASVTLRNVLSGQNDATREATLYAGKIYNHAIAVLNRLQAAYNVLIGRLPVETRELAQKELQSKAQKRLAKVADSMERTGGKIEKALDEIELQLSRARSLKGDFEDFQEAASDFDEKANELQGEAETIKKTREDQRKTEAEIKSLAKSVESASRELERALFDYRRVSTDASMLKQRKEDLESTIIGNDNSMADGKVLDTVATLAKLESDAKSLSEKTKQVANTSRVVERALAQARDSQSLVESSQEEVSTALARVTAARNAVDNFLTTSRKRNTNGRSKDVSSSALEDAKEFLRTKTIKVRQTIADLNKTNRELASLAFSVPNDYEAMVTRTAADLLKLEAFLTTQVNLTPEKSGTVEQFISYAETQLEQKKMINNLVNNIKTLGKTARDISFAIDSAAPEENIQSIEDAIAAIERLLEFDFGDADDQKLNNLQKKRTSAWIEEQRQRVSQQRQEVEKVSKQLTALSSETAALQTKSSGIRTVAEVEYIRLENSLESASALLASANQSNIEGTLQRTRDLATLAMKLKDQAKTTRTEAKSSIKALREVNGALNSDIRQAERLSNVVQAASRKVSGAYNRVGDMISRSRPINREIVLTLQEQLTQFIGAQNVVKNYIGEIKLFDSRLTVESQIQNIKAKYETVKEYRWRQNGSQSAVFELFDRAFQLQELDQVAGIKSLLPDMVRIGDDFILGGAQQSFEWETVYPATEEQNVYAEVELSKLLIRSAALMFVAVVREWESDFTANSEFFERRRTDGDNDGNRDDDNDDESVDENSKSPRQNRKRTADEVDADESDDAGEMQDEKQSQSTEPDSKRRKQ